MSLNKEQLTFGASLALAVVLIATGGDSASAPRRTRGGGAEQGAVVPAFTPGRFIADDVVTWSSEGRNIFEAPSNFKPLPPLDLAPPPLARSSVPAPALPFGGGAGAAKALRRPYAPDPKADLSGGGAAAAAPVGADPLAVDPQELEAIRKGAGADPGKPLEEKLTLADRARMSTAERIAREEAQAKAAAAKRQETEGLDQLIFANGTKISGEFAGSDDRKKSRFEAKRDFDEIRRSPSLTEAERNDRLKKMRLVFFELPNGKRGRRQLFDADKVAEVKLADTPLNRYEERRSDVAGKDLAAQLDALKPLVAAGEYAFVVQEIGVIKARTGPAPELYVMLADALQASFEYDAELATAREAAAKFPDVAAIRSRLGRALAKLGLRAEAQEAFRAALEKDPADHAANLGLGEMLLAEGKAQAATAPLREAVNATNVDSQRIDAARLKLAEALLAAGDGKNAQAQTDVVLDRFKTSGDVAALSPERRRVHRRASALAASAAIAQGRLSEARQIVDAALTAHGDDGMLSYLAGVVALGEGRLGDAKRRLDATPGLDPLLTGRASAALAQVFELAGRDAEATGAAEAAAKTADPRDPLLKRAYARALLNSGSPSAASEQFMTALDAEPDDADVLVGLGDAAYRENKLVEAGRYFDRAAKLEPDFPDLLARRIVVAVRRKKLDEAEGLVATAGGASARGAQLQAAVAFFHYQKGNHAEALGLLQKLGADGAAGAPADYARRRFKEITDNQTRQVWTDQFNRTGAQPGRRWGLERGSGVNIALAGQAIRFEGKQTQVSDRPTVLYQPIDNGESVHSFSIDLTFEKPLAGVYAGVGVLAFTKTAVADKWPGFQERQGGLAPFSGLQIAVAPDGRMVWRKLEKAKMGEWQPVPRAPEGAKSLSFELRQVDPREGKWDVLVNKEPLLVGVEIPDLKRWRKALELQVFCHGALGADVQFDVDNAVVVSTKGN
jgi:tetratricopeptide (TPR) repeat protein